MGHFKSPLPPHPWAPLDPWDLPGASGSLGSLQVPWGLSQTQEPCSPCSLTHLTPCSPLTHPWIWASLGPTWVLRKPWEPSEAFGNLGPQSDSGTLFPLLPSPLHPQASLGPWDLPWVSGSLGSLQQPWGLRGLVSLVPFTCPCSPLPPYAWSLPGSWNFPGISGSLGGLWKPSADLGPHSDSEARGWGGEARGARPHSQNESPGETFTTWYLKIAADFSLRIVLYFDLSFVDAFY